MFNNIQTQRRTHESPMDWEWQTKGPADPNSPFPQYKPQQGQKPFQSQQSTQKSTSSFLKSGSTPAPQFRNPSFTTPRKPFDRDLFSEASGAESSPADNADAEDTPEISRINTAMAVLQSPSEKKPIFGRYGAGFHGSSPGMAEQRKGKVASTLTRKLRKRKRTDRDVKLFGAQSDSDSDSGESRPRSKKGNAQDGNTQGWLPSFLSGIESRPNLPRVLSIYIQLGLNFFFFFLTVMGVYSLWSAVKGDIEKASEVSVLEAIEEIAQCARDFVDNRCGLDQRAPALKGLCSQYEVCMNRDAYAVGRARVSAHTFAQILNSFVEPISYKALIFIVVILVAVVATNNIAFGMFRSKHANLQMPTAPSYFPPPPTGTYPWDAPPQTPQWGTQPQTPRTNHHVGFDTWGQEVRAIMPSQTPSQRSPTKGSRSPSKEY
ncbi:Di-sulfide bridge nucleocytoplasmic transport domain-containing protein [Amylocarpus encephaloides]|uniref:Di-sulfide bridge nucleocytoplasmic transport domain-containing protein n=1 Tax=Amylocarpus encephaloides TaxID=45428 RepID=A0A9P7YE46_9HELO|nr:Di-sulfide bridge nucleocytoplasmic transport domain-containing protein [Amylocarpus encephaloides]